MAGERFTPFVSPESGITRRAMYERVRSALWQERTTNEPHWRDLNDYISPRKARWFTSDRNKGDRRNQKIIDSTATFSLRTLQSGMHAGMTSPARPWMRLATPDPDLNEYGPVREWLHVVTQRMLTIFQQTNLYNALPVHYGCKGLFATAATSILDDTDELFRTYSYPIGSYAIGVDYRGRVNQWVYECQKTVLEVVESYLVDRKTNMIDWSRASQTLRNQWDQANYNSPVDICWIVVPNREHDANYSLDPRRSKPFASVHFEKGQEREDTFLKESGFEEFPVMVSRWDVTGDDYWGTDCPGMVALGDVKQLQNGEKRSWQAVEKQINPPLQAPSNVRNQKASLLPGDITYNDVREGQKGIHPIHETNVAIDQIEMKQQQTRGRVQRAFYEDLFLMLAYSDPNVVGTQRPTATEVVERKEEKLIALGPVLERSKDELHDPMIDRVFAMMDRANLLPEPPEELTRNGGTKLKVEYISVLAQAQKLVGVVGHERFLQGASQLVAIWPEAKHKVNIFQAIDDYNEMLGNNPKLVVPDDEARAAADKEAQAAMAMAKAKAMRDTAGAVNQLAGADMSGDSALTRMSDAMTAPNGLQQPAPAQ